MAFDGEVTLTVHGLPVDNGNVRAEVFATKFRALLSALRLADKLTNQKKSHDYLIVGLDIGSALATLRERASIKQNVPASSVRYVNDVVESVYNGDRNIARYPSNMIEALAPLVSDVGKKFSHGEIRFANDNVIRIDDYLAKQLEKAVRRSHGEVPLPEKYFEGIAFETLDGVVKELDARGALVRGKLVLTAGGKEIDCVFRGADIPILRESFNLRARVETIAHYDGESPLPVRLDVKRLTLVDDTNSLLRWKGALGKRKRGAGLDL